MDAPVSLAVGVFKKEHDWVANTICAAENAESEEEYYQLPSLEDVPEYRWSPQEEGQMRRLRELDLI